MLQIKEADMLNKNIRQVLMVGVLSVFGNLGYAQGNKVIFYRNSLVNQLDSMGQRAGLWMTFYQDDTSACLVDSGYYKDGRKVGVWTYNTCYTDIVPNYYTIDYRPSGEVLIQGSNRLIVVSADSAEIKMDKYSYLGKILFIACKKRKDSSYECVRYSPKGQIVRQKSVTSFDAAMMLVEMEVW